MAFQVIHRTRLQVLLFASLFFFIFMQKSGQLYSVVDVINDLLESAVGQLRDVHLVKFGVFLPRYESEFIRLWEVVRAFGIRDVSDGGLLCF
jgi:hypothetical protein